MIAPRALLKRVLPPPLRRATRFLYRLPVHYRMERSYQICSDRQYGHDTLALSHEIAIAVPDNAIASSVFRHMAFETRGRTEVDMFLRLAEGKKTLVDLGASGGFFSALFARSRPHADILSVEFDPPSLPVLEQSLSRNQPASGKWLIDSRGIGDSAGTIEVVSSGYGSMAATQDDMSLAKEQAAMNHRAFSSYQVRMDRLETVCRDHGIIPDIMKVDIEGFEFEMIKSSLDFLREVRPRLSLELHVDKLRKQGKSSEELLDLLGHLGYKLAGPRRPLAHLLKMVAEDGAVRAGLSCDL